ncbi:HPP family protein [Aureimonas frigidaquae]|uniref:CBS domain containing membrane protein n=1 Tax=Aureimonas frigidaquae TaxID=424757 RepID=A0A0P0Z362_9HYPH|nr:HPP family protein [Aureimonas frigidaquae]BAT28530.1 CBS domain containing membrane protein [Aureimonas frigidaquae]
MSDLRAALAAVIFRPILPGATLRERFWACFAAVAAVALTGIGSAALVGQGAQGALLIAPVGASAVLLFCVPASPLAQPWPIIGGNGLSALCGLLVASMVPEPALAAGLAVALAIAVMSLTRSLHPPGGAAALTAVLGGPLITHWGIWFAAVPVALNSALLVAIGISLHRLFGRSYPHRPLPAVNPQHTADAPPAVRLGFQQQDVDAALSAMHETLDVVPEDLLTVLREIEHQTVMRMHGDLICENVMSRDVVSVRLDSVCTEALALLLGRNLRILPIIAPNGSFAGAVGLRDVIGRDGPVVDAAKPCPSAPPSAPVASLVPVLTDGRHHAAVILNDDRTVAGIISQTDLLSAMGRLALTRTGGTPAR